MSVQNRKARAALPTKKPLLQVQPEPPIERRTSCEGTYTTTQTAHERPTPPARSGGGLYQLRASGVIPPQPAAQLIAQGYAVERPARDYDREGRFSVPGAAEWSVSIEDLSKMPGGLAKVLAPLTLRPKSGKAPEPGVISVFVPGLNTPEPEASRRTQLYVDKLDLPMANMANGSRESLGDFDPIKRLPFSIDAGQRDWISAGLSYLGLREPPLSRKVADLLQANLQQEKPQKMRLSFYSDATISMVQGLQLFTEQEVDRRMDARRASGERPRRKDVLREVQKDLKTHVFIELHGNASYRLPEGPRYLVWTDINDPLTFRKNPLSPQGTVGVSKQHPDPNQADVVYIDYEGPFSDRGFNAHNLAASGIHTIQQTLRRNGVPHGEALYDKAMRGEPIDVPTHVSGLESELWG